MTRIVLSDDSVKVSLIENQYTVANIDDAVRVVYSTAGGDGDGATVDQVFDTEIDESVAGVVYVGQAPPGSSAAAPVWRIKKITESVGGSSVNWAGGNSDFIHIWNNRLSLTYGP